MAANPAEDFISGNIQAGFDILNDKAISSDERRQRFASFLLGLTDVKRVALFLLGRYATGASAADLDAYVAAYQDYVLAVYQSYFALYAGQSLHVLPRASARRAISSSPPTWWAPEPRRWKSISACAPMAPSLCWWILGLPVCGWPWRSATSSSPCWRKTTAISKR